jgi:aminoglycoside 3-N-acetyltransferase
MSNPDSRKALYTYHQEPLTPGAFEDALKAVGIRAGDTLFVHSDVLVFGKVCEPDLDLLMGTLINVLDSAAGPTGRLVMPAFTYSFCKNTPFDVAKSRSTVGALTEFFRRRPGVVRSRHPIFSCAIRAADAADFAVVGRDSFGPDSIFAKLHAADAKLIFFGAPMHSMTYVHYVEQQRGIDYRFPKTFTGTIIDENGPHEDSCTFYVRDLKRNPMLDTGPLERRLAQSGALREARVGGGLIKAVSCRDVLDEALRLLEENPYGLLEKPV